MIYILEFMAAGLLIYLAYLGITRFELMKMQREYQEQKDMENTHD